MLFDYNILIYLELPPSHHERLLRQKITLLQICRCRSALNNLATELPAAHRIAAIKPSDKSTHVL